MMCYRASSTLFPIFVAFPNLFFIEATISLISQRFKKRPRKFRVYLGSPLFRICLLRRLDFLFGVPIVLIFVPLWGMIFGIGYTMACGGNWVLPLLAGTQPSRLKWLIGEPIAFVRILCVVHNDLMLKFSYVGNPVLFVTIKPHRTTSKKTTNRPSIWFKHLK